MFKVASSPPPPNDVSRDCTCAASCVITCRGQHYEIKFKHELVYTYWSKNKNALCREHVHLYVCLCPESATILCKILMKFGTGVLDKKLTYIKIGSGAVKLYLRV
jgi:hypothetical protein